MVGLLVLFSPRLTLQFDCGLMAVPLPTQWGKRCPSSVCSSVGTISLLTSLQKTLLTFLLLEV